MSLDREMEQWTKGWKASSEPLVVLPIGESEIRRQVRRLRRKLALEYGTGALFLVGSLAFALVQREPETWLWAACIWMLTAVMTSYAVWNWRSVLGAQTESVADYEAFCLRRARSGLREANFGLGFLAVSVVITGSWFLIDLALRTISVQRFWVGVGLLAVLSPIYLVFFLVRRRRCTEELQRIDAGGSGESPDV